MLSPNRNGCNGNHNPVGARFERWEVEATLMEVEGEFPPANEDELVGLIHKCQEIKNGFKAGRLGTYDHETGFMVVRLVRGYFQDDYEKACEFYPRIEDCITKTAFEVQWDDVDLPSWTLYRLAATVPMTWDKEGLENLRNNRSHIRQIAGISWRLQELTGNGTFGLPQELLANYLGVTQQDISKAIHRLLKLRWLKAVRPKGHTLRYSCPPYERTLERPDSTSN